LAAAADAMVAASGPEIRPVDGERGQLEENYGRFVALLRDRGWLPWPA
jgi:xylulokinase